MDASELWGVSIAGPVDPKLKTALQHISASTNTPISRLVAIAIENEMEAVEPFTYSLDFPDVDDYFQCVKEMELITAYLKAVGKPIPVFFIVIMRRSIGIPDKTKVLEALKSMLMIGTIELIDNKRPKSSALLGVKELVRLIPQDKPMSMVNDIDEINDIVGKKDFEGNVIPEFKNAEINGVILKRKRNDIVVKFPCKIDKYTTMRLKALSFNYVAFGANYWKRPITRASDCTDLRDEVIEIIEKAKGVES